MQTYRAPAPIQPFPAEAEKTMPSLQHRLLHLVRVGNWAATGMKDGRLHMRCVVCGEEARTFRRKTSWQWGDMVFSEIAFL